MSAANQSSEILGCDEVAAALAWHGCDAEATIRTLLADCKHLREQLALTEIAMSVGFSRGWVPCPECHSEMAK